MTVTVYGAPYSTYTRSALIALREKGVAHALAEVDIFKPIPAEHLARQPWGKIPALDHDGFELYETNAVLRYIDEGFPGASLQPDDPRGRARMTQIIGIVDSYGYKPIVVELFVQRAAMPMMGQASDEAKIAAALPEAEKALDALLAVRGQGPFMVGGRFGLADIHLAPVLAYLRQTPEGRAMIERRPALGAFWEQVSERASVSDTRSPLET